MRFVYEEKYDSFSEEVAATLVQLIQANRLSRKIGRLRKTVDYTDPLSFSISVTVTWIKTFNPEKRAYFRNVPWERINFVNTGFAIDAYSIIPTDKHSPDPEIEIHIVINPETEPKCYQSLQFKLLDSVRHEVEHLLQKGTNKSYGHSDSTDKVRKCAQTSFAYFLLRDEMQAMISGMRLSSIKKNVQIDKEFEEYLLPIKESGFITQKEMQLVINRWIKFTIKHFPGTKISEKYQNI